MKVPPYFKILLWPAAYVVALACNSDASTQQVADTVDSSVVAVADVEVKLGWADKAYIGMTRGEFLKTYATDVIKEEDCWNYGIDGGESMGMLVEREG